MKIAVAWYCIVVGVLLAVWWANDLRRGAWNRGDRTHGELGLHLAAESVTAALLIASGAAWLVAGRGAAARTASGMLIGRGLALRPATDTGSLSRVCGTIVAMCKAGHADQAMGMSTFGNPG